MIRGLGVLFVLLSAGCGDTELDAAIANGAKKLSKAEAVQALSDHTLVGAIPHLNIEFTLYYAADGRLLGAVTGALKGRDRGVWRVADDGQVCLRWSEWEEGDEKCRELWQDKSELKIFEQKSGRAISVAKSKPGNVRNLEVRSDLEIVQTKEKLEPVSSDELRSKLVGNTATGRAAKDSERHTFYAADNRVWVSMPSEVIKDHGTYRIADGGKVCATWSYLHGKHERCESWLKSAKGYLLFDPYGSFVSIAAIRSGDAEQLGK
jgi:hypothetical protein